MANVPGGWRGPTTLEALFDGPPELVAEVRAFLPQLRLVVDDLSQLDGEALRSRRGPAVARLAWWALSTSTDLSRLDQGLNAMRLTIETVRSQAPHHLELTLRYLQALPMSTAQRERVEATFEVMSLKEYRRRHPEIAAPIIEEWRAESRAEGRAEGLAEGKEAGTREATTTLILALWKTRFGKPPGRTAVRRIQTASVGTLQRWATRLVTAKRPADVFD
jgi:hypothetical protein